MAKGRVEGLPKLNILKCKGVISNGNVREVEGDGDVVTGWLGAMNGGGCGLKRGGKF